MALPIKDGGGDVGLSAIDDYNNLVVSELEDALTEAKKNHWHFCVWIGCAPDDRGLPGKHYQVGWKGGSGYDFAVNYALSHLQNYLLSGGMVRELPPSFCTTQLDADYVIHNLAKGAMSFDFCAWLVDAEMTRIKEGAPAPLKVCFFHPTRPYKEFDEPHAAVMFENVVRPMVRLIGAVETDKVCNRMKEKALFRDVSDMARQGVPVPKFSASGKHLLAMRGYADCVTITLRECDYWPHRNSNIEEWFKFAYWLKDRGERVVFVRDTKYANAPLDTWETCPVASTNLEMRMALYQQARCNCFVSNGPWNLALFSDAPWMMFVTVESSKEFDDRDKFPSSRSGWWKAYHGVAEGEQFPWSNPRQRIVWENDTYARMKATWRDFFDSAERVDIPSAGSMRDGKGTNTDGFSQLAAPSI